MKILIFDRNETVKAAFRSAPEVSVTDAELSDLEVDAVVSPANSFGFMDGGIDHAYSILFGWGVQERLQGMIKGLSYGELLVGQALAVPTYHVKIPYVISAPTMRVPNRIHDLNDIMLASRAAVGAARREGLKAIAFPGMGTGCGGVNPERAAVAMLCGIRNALAPLPPPRSWLEAQFRHFNLVSAKSGDAL